MACEHEDVNASADDLEERSAENHKHDASETGIRSGPGTSVAGVGSLSKRMATDFPRPDLTAITGISSGLSKLLATTYRRPDLTAISSGLSELLATTYRRPDLTAAVAGLSVLAAQVRASSQVGGQVAGFDEAARTLLDDLGWNAAVSGRDIVFAPSTDDSAYEAIAEVAPDVAMAVDKAAAKVRTPFWTRRAVRNSLAWMLVTLVSVVYVAGVALPPPWGSILSVLLGISGVSGPAVYRLVSRPDGPDGDASH